MSVAPNGRIDVIWNDTRNTHDIAWSELYYSNSTDGGETWSPNIPVSQPFITTEGGYGGNDKVGDYYHMVSDNLGANVAYAATFNGDHDVYFLRIGPWDRNGNEVDDAADIANATSRDCNAIGVPDDCEYRADFDGDSYTTLTDYAAFTACSTGPTLPLDPTRPCCELADTDHDGDADLKDFYSLQRDFVPR